MSGLQTQDSGKITFLRSHLEPIAGYNTEKVADFLQVLNKERLQTFRSKDAMYGGSWQKDGILSAYMNLKRKYDRITELFRSGNYLNASSQETTGDTLLDLSVYSDLNIAYLFFTEPEFRKKFIQVFPQLSEFQL